MLSGCSLTTKIPQGKFAHLRCIEVVYIPEVVHKAFHGDWMILLADEEEGFAVVQPDDDGTVTIAVPTVTVGCNIIAMSVTGTCSMLAALVTTEDHRLELRIWTDVAQMLFTPSQCTTPLPAFPSRMLGPSRLLWTPDEAFLVVESDGILGGVSMPRAWALPDGPLDFKMVARPHSHIPLKMGSLAVASSSWDWVYVGTSVVPVYGSEDFPPASGIVIKNDLAGQKFPVVAFVQDHTIRVATGLCDEGEEADKSSLLFFPKATETEVPGELCFLPRTGLYPCLRLASSNANQRSITIRNFSIWDVERTITFPEAVLPRGLRPPIISMTATQHQNACVSTKEIRERDHPESPLPSKMVRGVANVMGEAAVRSRGGVTKLRERARSSGFGFMLNSHNGSSSGQSPRLSRDNSQWTPVVMLILAAGDLSDGVLYSVEVDCSSSGSLIRADTVPLSAKSVVGKSKARSHPPGRPLCRVFCGTLGLTCPGPAGPLTLWRPFHGSRINKLGGPETIAVDNKETSTAQAVMVIGRLNGDFLVVGDAHTVQWYSTEDHLSGLVELYTYQESYYDTVMDCSGTISSADYEILIVSLATGISNRPFWILHVHHIKNGIEVSERTKDHALTSTLSRAFAENFEVPVTCVKYLLHYDTWALIFGSRIGLFSSTRSQWVALDWPSVVAQNGIRGIAAIPHSNELLVIPHHSNIFYAVSDTDIPQEANGAFIRHDSYVSILEVLRDPSRLVSADEAGVLLVWHIPSRVCLCSLDGHYNTSNYRFKPLGPSGVILSCQLTDDPRDLITVDVYGVCIRWDMLTCRVSHLCLVGRGSSLAGFTSFGGVARVRPHRTISLAADVTVVGFCVLRPARVALVLSDGSLEIHPIERGGEASLAEIWAELTALSDSAASLTKGAYSFQCRDAGTPGWVLATLLRTQPRLLLDWLPDHCTTILHYLAETDNTAGLATAYAVAEEFGIELSFRLDSRLTSTLLISLSNKSFKAVDVQLAYATSLSRHGAGYVSSLLTPILMASTYRAADLPSLRTFLDSRLMPTDGNRKAPEVLPSSGRHEITSCITSSYYSLSANAYGLPRKDYYRALGIRKPESDEYTTESNIRVLCLPNASWSLKWDLWFSHLPDDILTSPTMRLLFAHQWQAFGWVAFMTAFTQWLLYVAIGTKYIIDYNTDRDGREVLAIILLVLSFAYYVKEFLQLRRISWRSYLDDATNLSLLSAVTMMVALIIFDFATDYDFHEHWRDHISISQYASITMIVLLINSVTMFRGFENLAWMFRLVVEVTYSVRWFFVMLTVFVLSFMLAVWVVDYPVDNTQSTLGGPMVHSKPGSIGRIWNYFLSVYRIGLLGDTMESQIDNMRGSNYLWFIFVVTTYTINITLLNLLIAIMSSSYEDISSRAAVMVSRERWAMLGETEFSSAGVSNWILSWFGRSVVTEKRYPRYLVANFPAQSDDPPTKADNLAADHPLALARTSLEKYRSECESSTTEMEMRMVATLGGMSRRRTVASI